VPKNIAHFISTSDAEFLGQSTCRFTFDLPHNLTGCNSEQGIQQNMQMILVDYTSNDPYFKVSQT
jgi:hypothetical protein